LPGELDVEDEGADAVALPVALARDLLLLREGSRRSAQVHDDVLLLEALDDAREELALPALELVVDDVALGVAHALDDVLLRGLCGDAAELLGGSFARSSSPTSASGSIFVRASASVT
jgi:hypothetical protein